MTHVDLTYCESLQEWTTFCTCGEGVPCIERLRDADEDRIEHERKDDL